MVFSWIACKLVIPSRFIPCKLVIPSRFIPCKLVIPSHFIPWKTHFLILVGSAFNCPNHIWQNALPANIRKWVFHEIKHDRITTFHGIHVIIVSQISSTNCIHRSCRLPEQWVQSSTAMWQYLLVCRKTLNNIKISLKLCPIALHSSFYAILVGYLSVKSRYCHCYTDHVDSVPLDVSNGVAY